MGQLPTDASGEDVISSVPSLGHALSLRFHEDAVPLWDPMCECVLFVALTILKCLCNIAHLPHFASLGHHLGEPVTGHPAMLAVALLGPDCPWKQLKAEKLRPAHSFRMFSPWLLGLACLGHKSMWWRVLFRRWP